ncbi:MAG: 50S ribosomal protein L4 [Firmicutes bacterium]|nr:50S ribosomal protein L4 [Bacillota bacterium]
MPTVSVYNTGGQQVGEIELAESLFACPIHEQAMYDVAIMQLANRRQGTASTKTRGEVRGGGRKPWIQKGTGRARHGSIRSPIWVGGGIAFGPKPRSYRYTMPKKIKRLALKSALSAKAQSDKVIVLDSFDLKEPKTKSVLKILQNLKIDGKVLLVTAQADEVVYKSARNLPNVHTAVADQLNVLQVLNADYLVFTREAVNRAEEVFA